jgi:glyceraldehyde-3-phosphate dehydrogenase (NADP+)
MNAEKLNGLFPQAGTIPSTFVIKRLDQREYLANGEIKKWEGPVQEVFSPVCAVKDGKTDRMNIGSFPLLSQEEAHRILDAAVEAYAQGKGEWPTTTVENRIKCVQNFVQTMKTKRTEVVNSLMWEIGKSLADSEKEFDRTVQYIEDTIEALKILDRTSSRFEIEEGIIGQIRRAPLGVVLCMGPFNYPLNETFTTLIPALIMGNTVVLKPAKYGILMLYPLLRIFRESFPKGVVNILYGKGREIINALMETGKIDVLAFIGSSTVSNKLVKAHPRPNRLRSVLGLNAKNPAIVLPDANIDNAVSECILGSLSFNGQRCTALKIIFVHANIVDTFLIKMEEHIDRLKIGMPWEPDVKITPLPEDEKPLSMKAYVDDAIAHGAKVVNKNGGAICETLFFPAVVYPVNDKMKLYNEEQFGPVIPVVPFDDIAMPISYIENSNFGQQVSIFGTDPDIIAKMIDPLVNQVSRVNINSQCQRGPDKFPFTGRKDSAESTLSVSDALRAFSIRALVSAKVNEQNKMIVTKIVRERKSNFLSTDFIL